MAKNQPIYSILSSDMKVVSISSCETNDDKQMKLIFECENSKIETVVNAKYRPSAKYQSILTEQHGMLNAILECGFDKGTNKDVADLLSNYVKAGDVIIEFNGTACTEGAYPKGDMIKKLIKNSGNMKLWRAKNDDVLKALVEFITQSSAREAQQKKMEANSGDDEKMKVPGKSRSSGARRRSKKKENFAEDEEEEMMKKKSSAKKNV